MSTDWRTYRREQARDRVLEYELQDPRPLSASTRDWMDAHGKTYCQATLDHFRIREALTICYQRAAKRRRSLWSEPTITIPAGPITRIYRHTCPDKADRWRVTPSGYPPQFIGTITGSDVLLVEGEWDFLCAFDHGFIHAATHTAGAGTWLPSWTPMFAGKRATVCLDRDEMGLRGTARVARALWPVAASVRIVDLPLDGTPEAKDLSDYFRAGGTTAGFQKLLEGARHYVSRIQPPRRGSGLRVGFAHV